MLDLSRNPCLTPKSYLMLKNKLSTIQCELSHLILEGNEMGDEACRHMCDMVSKLLLPMTVLNMSKCNITCVGAEVIAKLLLLKTCRIKCILLHWNKIMGRGSSALARAIEYNETL